MTVDRPWASVAEVKIRSVVEIVSLYWIALPLIVFALALAGCLISAHNKCSQLSVSTTTAPETSSSAIFLSVPTAAASRDCPDCIPYRLPPVGEGARWAGGLPSWPLPKAPEVIAPNLSKASQHVLVHLTPAGSTALFYSTCPPGWSLAGNGVADLVRAIAKMPPRMRRALDEEGLIACLSEGV